METPLRNCAASYAASENRALYTDYFFQVIIEELQIANCHLRKMVDSLFLELTNSQSENKKLKERIRVLEGNPEPEEAAADQTAKPGNLTHSRAHYTFQSTWENWTSSDFGQITLVQFETGHFKPNVRNPNF